MAHVASDLPLSALLSQVLVAFTIEFDNEFEQLMPHWTTNAGSAGSRQGPWLVSLVMWSNCMRFVGEEGVRVDELERLARTPTNLNGMERWGYIVLTPDPAVSRVGRSARIRATSNGRKAQEVWRPLFDVIEKRWRARFGAEEIDQLRKSLSALLSRMDPGLPECLPILGYGLFSKGPDAKLPEGKREAGIDSRLSLPALLSQVLLAFAIEFERESDLSLAICANVVRVLNEKGVRVRDLPLLTGVSKEAISTAMGVLEKRHAVIVEPDQTGRAKIALLTPQGGKAQAAYRQLLGDIEERWSTSFGKTTVDALRKSLARLAGDSQVERSPLFQGLEPYPNGWRASVPKPNVLPHYPMVLHRGGFPDGS